MPSFTIIIEDDREGPSITVEQSEPLQPDLKPTPARQLFNFLMAGLTEIKKKPDLKLRLYGPDGEPLDLRNLTKG